MVHPLTGICSELQWLIGGWQASTVRRFLKVLKSTLPHLKKKTAVDMNVSRSVLLRQIRGTSSQTSMAELERVRQLYMTHIGTHGTGDSELEAAMVPFKRLYSKKVVSAGGFRMLRRPNTARGSRIVLGKMHVQLGGV